MTNKREYLSNGGLYMVEREWRITPTPEPGIVVVSEFLQGIRTTSYLVAVDKLPQWAKESIALIDVAGGSLPGIGFKHTLGVSYYLEYKGEE